ncbi:HAD family hydrolase [Photobacterium lucens]|uniref:HAD family hydrolase n=1 Tax=Photobacterium lucens TaxID=2562949 RepID=UPI000D16FD16|nr:HAD family hydrolase [Photobacterium lucens]MBP2698590.1 HAD-IA family hydrolase [Vibrio parahaemolyticus]MZG55511.1 HAD family hydrolase [Photobacterium lucens]MZG80580.1 HAD family hydrolase [Photobacterium lucens]PSV18377.1 HAD family hydrolase [Photobacterium leiognathi subsp. mandapamensis]
MLKAIFLDMDETLCATSLADKHAVAQLKLYVADLYPQLDADLFLERYVAGVYKKLNDELPQLVPLLNDELYFRQNLIIVLFKEQGIDLPFDSAVAIQACFDETRMAGFDFFPGMKDALVALRKTYKLVVITNGPVFSQHPKLATTEMQQYVDHIIVGGEEPEEKPALSIFEKALDLVGCKPHEAIHMGDSLAADIAGANNAGIKSIWVDTQKEADHQQLTYVKPDFIVSNPVELTEIVASLA